MSTQRQSAMNRRSFLAASAAAGITIVRASQVRGSQANSTIEVGLIGCGGRGKWIAPLFNKHGGYKFVAAADYFQEKVDAFGEEYKVPADRRYATLSGYKKLLDSKLDAVIVETPPYFHPEQCAAAVDAGKHVYAAKPIAVDVPGCVSIADSGRKATEKKLVFLVDFQTRADALYREAAKRVHAGDIGQLVSGEAEYPWAADPTKATPTPEDRLRNWYGTVALSGDFIVEQNIHTLDVATWFINADPIKAYGTRGKGRLGRKGDISDNFMVIFYFPNDVVLAYSGIQAVPGAPNSIWCRIYGTKGVVDTDYYSHVWIQGKKPYKGGTFDQLYTTGTEVNIAEFHQAITQGDCKNPTVAPSVRSNLTCVLGRTAAYKNEMVTWDSILKKNEALEPDLSGLKS